MNVHSQLLISKFFPAKETFWALVAMLRHVFTRSIEKDVYNLAKNVPHKIMPSQNVAHATLILVRLKSVILQEEQNSVILVKLVNMTPYILDLNCVKIALISWGQAAIVVGHYTHQKIWENALLTLI